MGEEDGKLDIEGECVQKLNTFKYVGSEITNVQMCDRDNQIESLW